MNSIVSVLLCKRLGRESHICLYIRPCHRTNLRVCSECHNPGGDQKGGRLSIFLYLLSDVSVIDMPFKVFIPIWLTAYPFFFQFKQLVFCRFFINILIDVFQIFRKSFLVFEAPYLIKLRDVLQKQHPMSQKLGRTTEISSLNISVYSDHP